jgi:hypothetical protein
MIILAGVAAAVHRGDTTPRISNLLPGLHPEPCDLNDASWTAFPIGRQ